MFGDVYDWPLSAYAENSYDPMHGVGTEDLKRPAYR
jgi:hypothetical protein